MDFDELFVNRFDDTVIYGDSGIVVHVVLPHLFGFENPLGFVNLVRISCFYN